MRKINRRVGVVLVGGFVIVGAFAQFGASEPETASEPRALTVEDLWSMDRVADPQVSSDGRWVVLTVTTFSHEENKGNSDLWLVPSDGTQEARRLTWNEGSDSGPAWSPDGSSLIFVSKRSEGPAQLYRLPMNGGEAEPLTDLPIAVSQPKWFPDGKKIVFAASTFPDLNDDFEKIKERLDEREEDKTQAKISESRFLRYWDHYRTDGTVPHLFELDLKSRKVRDLMPGFDALMKFRTFEWDLAPDGEEIAFAANSTEPPWRELNFDIHLLNLETGKVENITLKNAATDGSPLYSGDGRFLLFGRNRRPEVHPDMTRLARYERSSGEMIELTGDWDFAPDGWQIAPSSQTVLFQAQNGGKRNLYKLSIDGGTPELVAEGGAIGSIEPISDDETLYLRQSFHRPSDVYRVDLNGGQPARVTSFNSELLDEIDFGLVEDVRFVGAYGDEVQLHVLLPPGFDPKMKWPLLVLVHGGPHGAWLDSFHFRWNAALFGAPGYVVAAVNFHGSTGFGQEYAESILGNHAELPFIDVMKATDHMLARDYIDPERMAVAGGSYGGYMVSWILGHTDRFAAIVNHAGVYDLMGQFASDYTWGRANNYGASPWEDPNRIDLYSPSRYAKNFNTPTLILHGEKDYRVPYTQGLNLHGVLTGKGVPSRIVILPDENHWVLKPQAAELWWSEVHAWLEKYIGKGPGEAPIR